MHFNRKVSRISWLWLPLCLASLCGWILAVGLGGFAGNKHKGTTAATKATKKHYSHKRSRRP